MIEQLSILIPVKDNRCLPLVADLVLQVESIKGLRYEILVADDGSSDTEVICENQQVEYFPHCRYLLHGQNVGRAAIRNYLAQQARFPWLLFLDCDVLPNRENFVARYLHCKLNEEVICGGMVIQEEPHRESNLRYRYEKSCARTHTAAYRQRAPYQSFRTTNFLVKREVLLRCPFDERIKTYGYEDVLWGKALREKGYGIAHIDNGVYMTHFEDNRTYLAKTREAIRTLHTFRGDLTDYSPLLRATIYIYKVKLDFLLTYLFRFFCACFERHLVHSSKPHLLIFKLYKAGCLLLIQKHR